MSDYFDFPALPAVIQDLIVEEIVHNSAPEDRIQFAMVCKDCNEMVKRAKPKKIISYLFILGKFKALLMPDDGVKMLDKSSEELIKTFKKCQIEGLSISAEMKIFQPDQNENQEFINVFFEACKFATKLSVHKGPNDEFIKFFKTLKHLKHLDFGDNFWLLEHCSYLPPMVRYHINEYDESCRQFLLKLAERSQQEPLSSVATVRYLPVDVIQEFLKAAKFQVNAKINFRFKAFSKKLEVFMTYLGGDSLRVEVLRVGAPMITVDQKLDGEKKRILTLQWIFELPDSIFDFKPPKPLPFTVKSSSSSNQTIFSGELPNYKNTKFTINDVNRNDWIKVDACQKGFVTLYANEMLNDCFPKNAAESWTDYYDNINRVLGTKIAVAKPKTLANTIEKISKKKDWFLEATYWSIAIVFYYFIMKIIGY